MLDTKSTGGQAVGQAHVREDQQVRVVVEILSGAIPEIRLDDHEPPTRSKNPANLRERRSQLLARQVLEENAREDDVERAVFKPCQ